MRDSRIALVTGSSSGIGLATAKALAASGVQVMLHGLEEQGTGDPIAQALAQEFGVQARYFGADLASAEGVEQLIDATVSQLGEIDILVNNAGIQYTATTRDFPVHKWDQVLAVNLSAAFHATRLVLPAMEQAGWGRVINVASVHGLVGSANKSAYCAAKHGLVGLTKVVALEQAANGITANAICPGWTDTPLLNHQIETFASEQGVSIEQSRLGLLHTKTPYPSLIDPASIGAMILFLCSDAAAAITGAALPIDGAWTAQ
jgi:3-hydroxybutyrate dehydrogenase